VYVLEGRGGKGASAGASEGSQIRQLTLGKGPAEMGVRNLVQGAAIHVRVFFFPNKTADLTQYYNMGCLV
jgi:hypothetical protein